MVLFIAAISLESWKWTGVTIWAVLLRIIYQIFCYWGPSSLKRHFNVAIPLYCNGHIWHIVTELPSVCFNVCEDCFIHSVVVNDWLLGVVSCKFTVLVYCGVTKAHDFSSFFVFFFESVCSYQWTVLDLQKSGNMHQSHRVKKRWH